MQIYSVYVWLDKRIKLKILNLKNVEGSCKVLGVLSLFNILKSEYVRIGPNKKDINQSIMN